MGYFSNGTEGSMYEEQWCSRCANQGDARGDTGCSVWDVHLLYAYSGTAEQKELLDVLIPRDERGYNTQCAMFRAT